MESKVVPIERIRIGEHVVRAELEDEELDGLCSSIRRVGVIVPLVVEPSGDDYVVVCGHRRFVAASRVGVVSVPVVIRKEDKSRTAEVSIAENLFRKDPSPVELAGQIKDVIEQKITDVEGVAKAMHRSINWVQRQLSLLNWPADVLKAVHEKKLSVSAASNLSIVTDTHYRAFLLRNAIEQGATARTTAAWLQAWQAAEPPEQAIQSEPVERGTTATAPIPETACIVCSQLHRSDALACVVICVPCLNQIRGVGA